VGAVASGNMTDEIDQLQKAMTAAGVTTKMMPNEQVGGKDAYHVQVTLPLDTINAALASDSSTTGMKLDSAGLDFWVYSDTYLPAKIEIKGSASTAGNLDLVVTLTDYGKAVTITAPSADQITG
jgi:hypothetical protein